MNTNQKKLVESILMCFPRDSTNGEIKDTLRTLLQAIEFSMIKDELMKEQGIQFELMKKELTSYIHKL